MRGQDDNPKHERGIIKMLIESQEKPFINKIQKEKVTHSDRLETLPRLFGGQFLEVEFSIYSWMKHLSKDYNGGYWDFFKLSNGGFYMAPNTDQKFDIVCAGNFFKGELSADAAGIVACLFTFSDLSFRWQNDTVIEIYHLLKDFSMEHEEATLIYRAID